MWATAIDFILKLKKHSAKLQLRIPKPGVSYFPVRFFI